MASFACAPHQAAELEHHGALYRGIYSFLHQFVELLEIDRH
jgi:hypothetical protein